ncbi:MAG: phage tail protein, partial [Bacteroidales bacterium]|nr:phage tail protein [Bacteroidales bacterium]
VLKETEIIKWCRKAIEDYVFEPTTVTIKLLGEDHNSLITWNLTHVWPKKWDIADLDAYKNEILVETLEMNYNFFTVKYES